MANYDEKLSQQDEPCPFCLKIQEGSVSDVGIHEGSVWDVGEGVYAFEPLNPVTEGHLLYISKYHVVSGDRDASSLMSGVYDMAMFEAERSGMDYNLIMSSGSSASQTIEHLHVHYVPRRPQDGLSLPWTGQVVDHTSPTPPPVSAHSVADHHNDPKVLVDEDGTVIGGGLKLNYVDSGHNSELENSQFQRFLKSKRLGHRRNTN